MRGDERRGEERRGEIGKRRGLSEVTGKGKD